MISSTLIEEIRQSKIKYGTKLFYLWVLVKYGTGKKINYEKLKSYGVSNRQIYRYVSDLENNDVIKREVRIGMGTLIIFK